MAVMSRPSSACASTVIVSAATGLVLFLACGGHQDVTATCPASTPAQGGACAAGDSSALNCSYGATCCTCVYSSLACSDSDQVWKCQETIAPAPCPATLPENGAACSGKATCSYCTAEGYFTASCDGTTFSVAAYESVCGG
jgi:hypothetical protein